MEENLSLENLSAEEIWQKLYNKELNCKKNILEYIDVARILKKGEADPEKIQDTYNFIYDNIEKMSDKVKPNTIMYLQNELKNQFGKYVVEKEPKEENAFIKFFREAYPVKDRRKDFTWVMMNINNIVEEQIWTTLIHINREYICKRIKLDAEEKEAIIKMIEKVIEKNNKKYINQIKSLDKLLNNLNIKIVNNSDKFKVKKL
ncbi:MULTISPECIES: hypothetical protein [Clostridium]|jgi:hypothetical protein|uniref:Uncharacterized protein n=2 Tax=Clostridium saccharoperbutylacetonicum TaxID=36745 RepID=M1MVQ2_9CLOT|nr:MULTISPECIES: hypothetical protein [Clostridium]AGF58701.1 hypothetical protein Cspa_c49480 [Clostridium saccharoperbutylacetonicum N1-4(HMT)]AQR97394.1 hypothetical protein CLSAP_47180 [Clostridium saccharoperbutylacetonicum]NRT60520.1 hypothetical protein [Clostridium saccharoperbutylacetonicum]NSB23834.1 hypothetical protein [Clostridium saccharoperbutylacetonicum]NSB33278.1 hypothetical protein [Clostridium saccharoperbutylacetonicum]